MKITLKYLFVACIALATACGDDATGSNNGTFNNGSLPNNNGITSNNGTTNNGTTTTCEDGELNQDETAIDCGGATCDACADGLGCSAGTDCASSVCIQDLCAPATCGDGFVNGEEACDGDGAGTGGESATCNTNCSVAACGDGQVNAEAGEACDGDAAGMGGETATCNADCSVAACGDGVVNTLTGEGCDDGNQVDDDACSNTCVVATCGDATVNNGETCDDGNQVDDDACSNTCVAAVCGDAIVNNGEACDDGNQDDLDACSNACVVATCGDAIVNNGEACDDGNQVDDDACSNACVAAVCGDAIVNNGEACDDGNQDDLDACSNTCVSGRIVALCGTSTRPLSEFVPPRFAIINTCIPTNDMQAMIITRTGVPTFNGNAAAIKTFVENGGKLLTEYTSSDDVFNGIFPGIAQQGNINGACKDHMPTVVQFTPGDLFWAENTFTAIPTPESGCGADISAIPGITPLAGWSATAVSVGYRDFGAGRVWFTDFDWQDGENVATFAYTASLMRYMIEKRTTVALCGTSNRPISNFASQFSITNTCVPNDNMQAMVISRSGLAGFMTNAAAIQTYVQDGGKVLTEYSISDDVFNAIFPETVIQPASQTGGCLDTFPTVVQFTPGDPFWANNTFTAIPLVQAGCGFDIAAFPGITPLAGWSATEVSVAYRDFGTGRVWLTEFDWQDNGTTGAAFSYTAQLLGYILAN